VGHPRHDHQVVEAYARVPVLLPARFCLVCVRLKYMPLYDA
jgi:hypothetical protein